VEQISSVERTESIREGDGHGKQTDGPVVKADQSNDVDVSDKSNTSSDKSGSGNAADDAVGQPDSKPATDSQLENNGTSSHLVCSVGPSDDTAQPQNTSAKTPQSNNTEIQNNDNTSSSSDSVKQCTDDSVRADSTGGEKHETPPITDDTPTKDTQANDASFKVEDSSIQTETERDTIKKDDDSVCTSTSKKDDGSISVKSDKKDDGSISVKSDKKDDVSVSTECDKNDSPIPPKPDGKDDGPVCTDSDDKDDGLIPSKSDKKDGVFTSTQSDKKSDSPVSTKSDRAGCGDAYDQSDDSLSSYDGDVSSGDAEDVQPNVSGQHFFPFVLLIPIRLGICEINSDYYPSFKFFFSHPSFLGW
jgi:hypothetical protein